MKALVLVAIVYLNCFKPMTFLANGQSFQNLDFESANVPDLPPGQFGGFVSISDALPGWNGFLGSQQQTEVLHNSLLFGSTGISLVGPEFGFSIEGSYTLLVFAGVDMNDDITPLPASISQTGVVPSDAQSLLFKAQGGTLIGGPNPFVVTLGGESISMVPLASSPPYYTLYGGDIASFAGRNSELTFTAFPFRELVLDSIEFSSVPIPEPTTWALLGLGALMAGYASHRTLTKKLSNKPHPCVSSRSSEYPE